MKKFLLAIGLVAICSSGLANDTVRLVVPFPPGGPIDRVARLVQKDMKEAGRIVVVENRPGADGDIALNHFVQTGKHETVFMIHSSLLRFLTKPNFESLKIEPVLDIGPVPYVLAVSPGNKFASWADFMAIPSTDPVTIASTGRTSASGLSIAALRTFSQKNFSIVNYQGAQQMITDVASGRVDMIILHVSALMPMIESKKLVPLTVMHTKRLLDLPDIPTAIEMGFAQGVFSAGNFILGLQSNSRSETEFWQKTMTAVLNDPVKKQPYLREQIQIVPGPKSLPSTYITDELKKLREFMAKNAISLSQ